MATLSVPFTSLTISPALPPLTVSGGAVKVLEGPSLGGFPTEDPASLSPNPSNGMIQTDQNITVNVTWTVGGLFNAGLSADYVCTAYFERMGVNEVAQDFSVTVPHVAQALPFNYNVNIPVAAGSLAPGMYHLVVSLTTDIPAGPGAQGIPLVGFVDLGCLQIYKA